jgi:arginyl-tRNA synthetase
MLYPLSYGGRGSCHDSRWRHDPWCNKPVRMADPAAALEGILSAAVAAAFPEQAGADPVVRPATNPTFGDYQANGAMGLAKKVGRPPRDVAAAIIANLPTNDVIASADVAGPGFVNLHLADEWLSDEIGGLLGDERFGIAADATSEVVVLDYSAPNVAKEMHVGHLRSTIIGDALARVLGFLGHRVVRQNHLGDWGTPFGMLIEHLIDLGADGSADDMSVSDLTAFYQAARRKFDADETFADRSRQRVVLLQAGDEDTLRLWHILVEESKRHYNEIYEKLGVLLTDDDVAGESMYNPMLDDVVDELVAKRLTEESDGALCVFPGGFKARDGGPMPLLLRYRTGGFGYDTTDLAAIRYRAHDLGGQRIIYVIDAGQSLHMDLVFAGARMAGWLEDGRRATHVGFGLVLGPDGKRLKTRAGDNPKLIDLLDEAIERAAKIVAERSELPAEEQRSVAHAVGIGGVKYADLSSDKVKDYVFDYDRMLATDGNTAAYLQYAVARCRSILRKAAADAGAAPATTIRLTETAERALALKLLQLDTAVRSVANELSPHKLATHLFELAQAFTSFYDQCPVLKASTEGERASRLALIELTADGIALGLGLLGIDVLERM